MCKQHSNYIRIAHLKRVLNNYFDLTGQIEEMAWTLLESKRFINIQGLLNVQFSLKKTLYTDYKIETQYFCQHFQHRLKEIQAVVVKCIFDEYKLSILTDNKGFSMFYGNISQNGVPNFGNNSQLCKHLRFSKPV